MHVQRSASQTGAGAAWHWHAAGVSVRGVSHEKVGQPCQDVNLWRELPDGQLVLAVADGAGSAKHSQIGAARAVVAAVDWVTELLRESAPGSPEEWHDLLAAGIQTAHDSVLTVARDRQRSPRELASTLIVLVATPTLVAALQVGDGAAIVQSVQGRLAAVTAPHVSEYVNETVFLTDDIYLDAAQFGYWEGEVGGVAALSDGLQLLAMKMPEATPYPAFFTPLYEYVKDNDDIRQTEQQLRAFLESDRIRERADDDLTLVVAAVHRLEQSQ